MIKEVRFFDFCRIELISMSLADKHTLKDITTDTKGSFDTNSLALSGLLYSNENLRKVTYAARHQNKNINHLNFDFLFSIYLDSDRSIVSVDVDTSKMISDHNNYKKDRISQGQNTCQESVLSVMTRYLLRAHLSLSIILVELEKAISAGTIPFSLKTERDYLDSGYMNGRIISPIKMFFSVIDLIIDDEKRFDDFISSMNYNNINDIFSLLDYAENNDDLKEDISCEDEDIAIVLNEAVEKIEKIGSQKISSKLIEASKKLFSEDVLDFSSGRDVCFLKQSHQ